MELELHDLAVIQRHTELKQRLADVDCCWPSRRHCGSHIPHVKTKEPMDTLNIFATLHVVGQNSKISSNHIEKKRPLQSLRYF